MTTMNLPNSTDWRLARMPVALNRFECESGPSPVRFGIRDVFEKINPSTGVPIRRYELMSGDDVTRTVARSREAFAIWQATSLETRRQVLLDTARIFQERGAEIARTISEETGKPLKESLESDLTTAVSVLHYYAKHGPKVLKKRRLPVDKSALIGRVHYERRVPRGVVAVISPWNYPLAIPVSGMAAALMGGNSVILKPSEETLGVGEIIAYVFQKVLAHHGLPTDTAQLIVGDARAGQVLVESDIDYVIFTGSDRTGYRIRETIQSRGKEASLELGGSDPMIILDSADDLDAVTTYAVWGRMTNAGQTCAAVKRLFVPRQMHDEVVQLLAEKMVRLSVGGPEDTSNHVGALISESQREALHQQVQNAVERGAQVVTGGAPVKGPGFFYQPTLLSHVSPDSRVLNEEVFGPVLPVVPYDTVDQAVKLANDSNYGLTGSVFGDPKVAARIAEQLQVGVATVNDVGATNFAIPSVPWQGRKNSGPGVSHGVQGLLDTTVPQTLSINYLYRIPWFRKQPWHYDSEPGDTSFSSSLLRHYGSERWVEKLRPGFLKRFLQNRSSRKI